MTTIAEKLTTIRLALAAVAVVTIGVVTACGSSEDPIDTPKEVAEAIGCVQWSEESSDGAAWSIDCETDSTALAVYGFESEEDQADWTLHAGLVDSDVIIRGADSWAVVGVEYDAVASALSTLRGA